MAKKELISDAVSAEITEIAKSIAREEGAHKVTVRKIINTMGVTNRVFYNRFHNVDEVLRLIYEQAVYDMRRSFKPEYDSKEEFFEYCMDIAVKVLIGTYDVKMDFSNYMFEHYSLTESNRIWWMNEVNKAIEYATENGLIKKAEPEKIGYSVWCVCRGYATDALTRGLSREEAVEFFRFGFGCFLEGLKK